MARAAKPRGRNTDSLGLLVGRLAGLVAKPEPAVLVRPWPWIPRKLVEAEIKHEWRMLANLAVEIGREPRSDEERNLAQAIAAYALRKMKE
jgi:hypothetical protein